MIQEKDLKNAIDKKQQQQLIRIRQKPQLLSLQQIYQYQSNDCGYCLKKNGTFQWSFTKQKMEAYTYELMMQRGWRRCGTYYYKPDLQKSCCCMFTHRLNVQNFKIKKDQKKTIKKLITLVYEKVQQIQIEGKQTNKKHKNNKNNKNQQINIKKQINPITLQDLNHITSQLINLLKQPIQQIVLKVKGQCQQSIQFNIGNKIKNFVSKSGQKSDYYNNLIMLLFGVNKKIFADTKYSLLQFVKDIKQTVQSLKFKKYKLQVERGGYLLFSKLQKTQQFQILDNESQKKIHEQSGFSKLIKNIKIKLQGNQEQNNLKDLTEKLKHENSQKFQVLKPDQQYKGEFKISENEIIFGKLKVLVIKAQQNLQSFKLYSSYAKDIHQKKQKSMSSYVNFLCLQALSFKQQLSSIPQNNKQKYVPSWDYKSKHQPPSQIKGNVYKKMGCYHMKYYLKDELIGVGVVDIVRDGLSSVYFYYNSNYKSYRLGVFSSLIQIQYVRWLRLSFPQFKNYYMGFYIPNCQKMSYKVDYAPCELLCPITYQFVSLAQQIKQHCIKLSKKQSKNFKLAPKQHGVINDMDFGKNLGPFIDKNLRLMYENRILVLKEINPQFFLHILKILKSIVPVWGKKIFSTLTLTI